MLLANGFVFEFIQSMAPIFAYVYFRFQRIFSFSRERWLTRFLADDVFCTSVSYFLHLCLLTFVNVQCKRCYSQIAIYSCQLMAPSRLKGAEQVTFRDNIVSFVLRRSSQLHSLVFRPFDLLSVRLSGGFSSLPVAGGFGFVPMFFCICVE